MNDTGTNKFGGKRIVLTAVGSLGDVHPYLALAQELKRRGHRPVLATVPGLRERVEAAGVEFAPLRAIAVDEPNAELMRRVFDGRHGVEFILRQLVAPALRTAYGDTLRAAEGADLLVAHPLTWTTRLVAEKRGLPWVSTQLAPASMLSALDPPLPPGLRLWRCFQPKPWAWRGLFRVADALTRRWLRPYDDLRRELGLPDTGNPLFEGAHAPLRGMAMFSPLFGAPQADWPPQTVATGFAFFRQEPAPNPALEAWLAAGPPPVILTLGSSAVMDPGDFFHERALAARRLGRRALLLGAEPGSLSLESLAARAGEVPGCDLFTLRYGAYAEIFPRGVAVVHQGGVGTTAEALRAGLPSLVVPFGADQPDNAARVVRLGVGRTLRRGQYRHRRVARELRLLLEQPGYAARAASMGMAIGAEDGAGRACDVLEALFA